MTTITGLLDGYYVYNFNKPPLKPAGTEGSLPTPVNGPLVSPATGRNFDSKHNQLALGLAEVSVAKAVAPNSRLGFLVRLGYGPTIDALTSPGDSDNKNILQAYGSFLLPVGGKDVTVDAGKFVTHLGQEVIEPSANWNFSRSYLFQYYIPYYHAGVRAALPFSPKFTATGYIYNGWNNVSFDSNGNKAFGFALSFTPSSSVSLLLNGLTSKEPAGLKDQPKNVLEPILTLNFGPRVTGVIDFNYDYGKGTLPRSPGRDNSSWTSYGVAGYLHFAQGKNNALTLRGEYWDDKDGFLTGVDRQKGNEVTLTYSIKSALFANAETRLEYRHDSTKQPGLFYASNGTLTKKAQDTIGLAEMLTF